MSSSSKSSSSSSSKSSSSSGSSKSSSSSSSGRNLKGFWYIRTSAEKGILDKVYIKQVNVLDTRKTGRIVNVLVDNFNEIWLPDELLYIDEAIDMTLNYWNDKLTHIPGPISVPAPKTNFATITYPDDIVYVTKQAQIGIMEDIKIKDANVAVSKGYREFNVMYVDDKNEIWLPDEIISLYDAKIIAEDYWRNKI
jgi:hypothetical protein